MKSKRKSGLKYIFCGLALLLVAAVLFCLLPIPGSPGPNVNLFLGLSMLFLFMFTASGGVAMLCYGLFDKMGVHRRIIAWLEDDK